MKKFTVEKAFENESFVECVTRLYARRLKHEDHWGSDNLSDHIEYLAETETDCCGIPGIAFKQYVENEEKDWDTGYKNRESNQFLNEIYELIEEKEDDLYEAMAKYYCEEGDMMYNLSSNIEEAAKQLSGMLSTDNEDHTEEWVNCLKDACKGLTFSLE